MSRIIQVADRSRIETFLRQDTALHIYELGDLDPFFWDSTQWYGLESSTGEIRAVALLYTGFTDATLLALERQQPDELQTLLSGIREHLPHRFHAHLSPGLSHCFAPRWQAENLVPSLKMVLQDTEHVLRVASDGVSRLTADDSAEAQRLYRDAYPDNFFDPRMLETGLFFGVWRNESLVCAAGVHVFSEQYRVAALGNIATLPNVRRQGLARRVTATLCKALLDRVDVVALNVHRVNEPAIACYRSLGFVDVSPYEEVLFDSTISDDT